MQQIRRQSVKILVVWALLLTACGSSFVDRTQSTLNTSLVATNAARDEFVAWDKAHQQELVATSETQQEAADKLAEYRKKRAPILRSFTVAYATIGAAAAMLPLIDKGLKKEADLVPLLTDIVRATIAIRDAYQAIRGDSQ